MEGFLKEGWPYTRKGINESAIGLDLSIEPKEGEYAYNDPKGRKVIMVFYPPGFVKKKNAKVNYHKYLNIK